MARWVARVRRSGLPGPEPARMIRPLSRRLSRVVESSGAAELGGLLAMYDWRMLSTSASVMEARRRRGQYSQICDSQRKRLWRAVSRSSGVTS